MGGSSAHQKTPGEQRPRWLPFLFIFGKMGKRFTYRSAYPPRCKAERGNAICIFSVYLTGNILSSSVGGTFSTHTKLTSSYEVYAHVPRGQADRTCCFRPGRKRCRGNKVPGLRREAGPYGSGTNLPRPTSDPEGHGSHLPIHAPRARGLGILKCK